MAPRKSTQSGSAEKIECFVIMPMTEPEGHGYPAGHFRRVFDDIFVPACEKAGFRAIHPELGHRTNLIHEAILRQIVEAPMVLCDLSSRNPNVLFELGLRQAFDYPVALVREEKTPQIFDIAPLKHVDYRRERLYHEVLEDQENIAEFIKETYKSSQKGEGVNSIIKLLSLTKPATVPEVKEGDIDPTLQLVRAEIAELRADFRRSLHFLERAALGPGTREPSGNGVSIKRIPSISRGVAEGLVKSAVEANIDDDKILFDLVERYGAQRGWVLRAIEEAKEAIAANSDLDPDDIPF